MDNIYAARIESLRELMRSRGWDAVVLTGSDPHGSEYPAERYKQVRWLTGFTGEAGDVVVTADHAGLWTDTRYFIQANRQLAGTGVELHKTRIPEQVLIPEWMAGHFAEEDSLVIAVDGLCMAASAVEALVEPLRKARVDFFVDSVPDLLSELWTDRPQIPQTPIFTVDSGESRVERMDWLRGWAEEKGYDAVFLSSLDEVAWMLNVRASDIEYNPLVISYLLITGTDARWFVLKDEVEDPDTEAVFAELSGDGIDILPYNGVEDAFSELGRCRLFVDDETLNHHLRHALGQSQVKPVAGVSPVGLRKACKNPVEIEGMREAHLRDGVAMEKFLYWLEKSVQADRIVTEWDAAVKLGRLRSEIPGYRGDSFETISAYGPGAALPHYITPKTNAPCLEAHGLYLCDSGGQYSYGTTDITRTVPLGDCTPLEREDYTLVLKGHIDLAMAVFPEGTPGCRIDALSREPLWRARRNFGHGTGHGVGYFLGVHEGPQDIRQNMNPQPLMTGMITSDEPGIYREHMHGVRHENLILAVEDESNDFGKWMRFETLTLCHFDTSAVEVELLDRAEIEWLNDYNRRVYETLAPLLPEDIAAWLKVKTAQI